MMLLQRAAVSNVEKRMPRLAITKHWARQRRAMSTLVRPACRTDGERIHYLEQQVRSQTEALSQQGRQLRDLSQIAAGVHSLNTHVRGIRNCVAVFA